MASTVIYCCYLILYQPPTYVIILLLHVSLQYFPSICWTYLGGEVWWMRGGLWSWLADGCSIVQQHSTYSLCLCILS